MVYKTKALIYFKLNQCNFLSVETAQTYIVVCETGV